MHTVPRHLQNESLNIIIILNKTIQNSYWTYAKLTKITIGKYGKSQLTSKIFSYFRASNSLQIVHETTILGHRVSNVITQTIISEVALKKRY